MTANLWDPSESLKGGFPHRGPRNVFDWQGTVPTVHVLHSKTGRTETFQKAYIGQDHTLHNQSFQFKHPTCVDIPLLGRGC